MSKQRNDSNDGIIISGGAINAHALATGFQASAAHTEERQGDAAVLKHATDRSLAEMEIFISHSSADETIVTRLITLIRSAFNLPSESIRCTSVDGYRLPAGISISDQLRQETHTAKVFIAVITPRSMNSKYVLFELGARWGSGKAMIPVLAGGGDATLLQGPLSAINALSCDNQAQLHQFVEDIAAFLGRKPDRAAAYQKCITELVEESTGTISRHG